MIMINKLPYWGVCCLAIPCGLYIYGFFPAPYYISFVLGTVILCASLKAKLSRVFLGMLIINVIVFIALFFSSKINVWSYYFIGIVALFFILCFEQNLNKEQIKSVIIYTVIFSVLLLTIDTFLRFTFPRDSYIDAIISHGNEDMMFYAYKHSYLFQDSNFVGLFLLSIYFLFKKNKNIFSNGSVINVLIVALVFFSLSRAAIISFLLVFLMEYINSVFNNRMLKLCLSMFFMPIVLLMVFLGGAIFNIFEDESFESKIFLINKLFDTLLDRDIGSLFFGWGFDNTRDYWGIAAHNLYGTLMLESGIIGTTILLSTFVFLYSQNKGMWPQLLSISIASISFGLIFSPVTVPIALNFISRRLK